MTERDVSKIVEQLRGLLESHIKAQDIRRAAGPRLIVTGKVDLDKLFKTTANDDQRVDPADAIWFIGDTLGRCGGFKLMKRVYRAVAMKHGNRLGSPLVYCWNGAADRWYA